MAISANVAYSGNGPTATGQILGSRAEQGNYARTLIGNVTFTGDAGGSTTATMNYIDGTNVLGFAPSALILVRNGGTAPATSVLQSIVDGANNGLSATATFSAALGSGSTAIFSVLIGK